MQYIDIDSSFRNRTRFPNQAEFEILIPQLHLCDNDKNYMQDPVSYEAILYPNPEDNPQIAFYRETITEPFGELFMMNNLPLMYKTERDDLVQLDFLPLMPITNTSDQIELSPLYPNYYIPLGAAMEFYTGNTLEDVDNNEYRTITGLNYNTDTFIFQMGRVTHSASFGSNYFVYSSVNDVTNIPLSNISRYYQGKYMEMTSGNSQGESQLIIDYIPGEFENTFQLQYAFGSGVSNDDSYQIISNQSWFASLSSPFTNALPTYPVFRDPIQVSSSITFFLNKIYTSTRVIRYISATVQQNGSGISFLEINGNTVSSFPLADSYYVTATDDTDNNWLSPKIIYNNVYSARIGVTTFVLTKDYLPSIAYAIPSASVFLPAGSTVIYENYSLDPFGTVSWKLSGGDGPIYTSPLTSTSPPDQSPTIHVCQSPDASEVFRAYVIYSLGPTATLYFQDNVMNTPTAVFTVVGTNIINIFKLMIINGNPSILYSNDTNYYFVRSSTADGSSFAADVKYLVTTGYAPSINIRALNLDLQLLTLAAGTFPVAVLSTEPPSAITTILAVSPVSTGETTPWNTYVIWTELNSVGIEGSRIIQHTVDGTFYTFVFSFSSNGGLQFDFSTNLHSVVSLSNIVWNGPVIIDHNIIYDMDVFINNSDELIIVYSRSTSSGGSELIYLKINDNVLSLSRPYRIRYGIPLETGGVDTLVNSNSDGTEIILPSYAQRDIDIYSHQFFYIFNANTFDIPNQFHLYNDFRQIIAYNVSTNTITLESKLSANPLLYGLAPYGTVYTFLEFLTQFTLGADSSPFSNSYTVEANADYLSLYVDSNNVLLENLLSCDGTVGCGVFRNISSDTDLITLLESGNLTISIWVLFNSFTGNPHIFSFTKTDHTTFIFRIFYDTGAGRLVLGSLGYITSIFINIWYNITIVFEDNIGTLYVNNVLTVPVGTISFDTVTDPGFIDIGGYDSGTLNPLNGYIKNVAIINDKFNTLQISNIYNFGLNTLLYSLAWEIWGETKDNFTPIDNTCSNSVVFKQNQCYEIELIHLSLPNVILSTSRGNRIAFYSYVYVDFACVNTTNGKMLISNNPYTTQHTLFKVPIRDTSTPDAIKFVNNSSGMRQVIKFDSTASYLFRVFIGSTNELFTTQQHDTVPPLPANPILQISATFSIKRIEK